MNLYERIQEAMRTDDEDTDKQSHQLESQYEKSDARTKETLDDVFMTLTGWKLSTLIEGKERL